MYIFIYIYIYIQIYMLKCAYTYTDKQAAMELLQLVEASQVGEALPLTVLRGDQELNLAIRPAALPHPGAHPGVGSGS
jgi:hypothetical protein